MFLRAHKATLAACLCLGAPAFGEPESRETPSPMVTFSVDPHPKASMRSNQCRITMVRRDTVGSATSCSFATATHCLVASVNAPPAQFVEFPNGAVAAIARQERKGPIVDLRATNDIAVFQVTEHCDDFPAPVVAIRREEFPRAELGGIPAALYVTSRSTGQLATALVRSSKAEDTTFENIEFDVSPAGVYRGDSGGGIFFWNDSLKRLELVAVASVGYLPGFFSGEFAERHRTENFGFSGFYANRDMDWLSSALPRFRPPDLSPQGAWALRKR